MKINQMNQTPMTLHPAHDYFAVNDHDEPSIRVLLEVIIFNTRATCLIDSGATSSILSNAFRIRVNLVNSTSP
jgi:hypothetical protein